MSYESRMLADLAMPNRGLVQRALLRTLLKHGEVVKEFAAGEEVVGEFADQFHLNSAQRAAALETNYRRENRLKKTLLWHRLLFRAANALAAEKESLPIKSYEVQKVINKLVAAFRPENYQPSIELGSLLKGRERQDCDFAVSDKPSLKSTIFGARYAD